MRTLFIAVALLAMMPAASACDVCGCSIGGNYFGNGKVHNNSRWMTTLNYIF